MIFRKSVVNTFLLYSILGISLVVLVSISYIFTSGQKRVSQLGIDYQVEYTGFRKSAIKDEIGIVVSFIDFKLEEAKKRGVPVGKEVKAEILSWINRIRLRENQYIVVNTMDGKVLAHYKTGNIGKNMWGFTDSNGVKAVQAAIEVSQKIDGGFVSYVGSIRPSTGKPGRKITYAKSVSELGWVVLTGIYIDDIEIAAKQKQAALTQDLRDDLIGVVSAITIAMLLLFAMTQLITRRLRSNFLALTDFFKKAASKTTRIDPERLYFREFQELAEPVNQMIEEIKKTDAQLHRQQAHLEEVVKSRTAELQKEIETHRMTAAGLAERESTLNSIFRAAPVGIGMVKDRVFTQINDRISEMLGYSQKELLGKGARMVYPTDEDFEFVGREKYRQITDKGTGTVETRWLHKDGRILDILLSSTPLNVGDWSQGVTFTALDITERKTAERALKKSEEKFRNIFENFKDVYFETTLDGTIKNTSPSGADFSGYPIPELIGKGVDILYFDPRDCENLMMALKTRGRVRDYEVLFQKRTGEPYDVSINADLSLDEEGIPDGLTGTIRDITQQKRMKEQLQRSRKMESLGIMAGGIAHDLNNILSGVVSYPDLLLVDLPTESPLRKPIETIKDSGRRAADVVSDLLTVARGVASGKQVLNLNDIIKEYLDSPEHKRLGNDHPGVRYIDELETDLLNIACSYPHMNKILMNLVSNASESIVRGGQVTITTENRYLAEPLAGYAEVQEGEYVQLMVADTGSGISPQDIDRIFEPFYTKKVMGRSGTGLGLTVVWNTVQEHNGYVIVTSHRDGTRFELYFPATRDSMVVADRKIAIDEYTGNGQTILVVDDEPYQREIACGLLSKLNYSPVAAASGEEAVEYLKHHSVDLVIIDMIMPRGIDGTETYKRVANLHPGQKAIIASGFAETENVRIVQKMGAGAFIKKPYTLEKIGVVIRDELDAPG